MARTLALVGVVLLSSVLALPATVRPVSAAELDKNGKSDATAALRLYKQGNYEDAAKIFLKLSIAYPDMLVFVRNLGACYYYMRRIEPALSNLRDYVHRKKDIAADDRTEVEGWIGELERMRDQAAAVPAPAPEVSPPATTSSPAPVVAGAAGVAAATTPDGSGSAPSVAAGASSSQSVQPQAGTTSGAPPGAPPQTTGTAAGATYQQAPAYAPPYAGYPYTGAAQGYAPGPYASSPPGYPAQPGYGAGAPTGGYPAQSAPPATVVAQQTPQSGGGGRRVAAWVLGIAGVGSAGLGTYFAITAQDRFSKVEKKFDPTLEKQGKSYRTGAWICFGAGGAALLAAVIVGSTGGSSSGTVAMSPMVLPSGAGAVVSAHY
jgi:tetratricopeptide (TPR) repeat protein